MFELKSFQGSRRLELLLDMPGCTQEGRYGELAEEVSPKLLSGPCEIPEPLPFSPKFLQPFREMMSLV